MSTTTAAAATRRSGLLHSPAVRRGALDVTATLVLLAIGALTFGPVFGNAVGYVAAGTGVVLGAAIAVVATMRRWTVLGTLLATMVGYLVVGGAIVLPRTTIAGFFPSLDTLQRLVLLAWQSWRDLLTVSLPAGQFDGPAALPFLTGLACSVVSVSVALRAARPYWALLPSATFLTVAILWGAHGVPFSGLLGAAYAVVALGWLSWRVQFADATDQAVFVSPARVRPIRLRRAALGLGSATVAALLAVGIVQIAGTGQRHVLRDEITPPLDLRNYASPLTMYRDLETVHEKDTLFTVAGLPAGARIRLAAMDLYDGNVYNVSESSAEFARAGSHILPGIWSDTARSPHKVTITIDKYAGVWLPGGGDLRGITFSDTAARRETSGLYFNPATGTALTTAGVAQGTRYRLSLVTPPALDQAAVDKLPDEPLAPLTLPPSSVQVDAVQDAAASMVGKATTPMDELRAIAHHMSTEGRYANGTRDESLAGHTIARTQMLLASPTGQMVGDDEQYAVAMALIARQLGIPARVVMGFHPARAGASTGTTAITGADAHVWVEVPFQKLGWVPFDPTPDKNQVPDQQQPQPQERNDPQVLPPPDIPDQKDHLPPAKADSEQTDHKLPDHFSLPAFVVYAALVAGTLVLAALPFLAIVLLKTRRRASRRQAQRVVDRISGGWAELADLSTDLGTRLPPYATRLESASILTQTYDLHVSPVATRVDAHVFGEDTPTDADVAELWTQVDAARADLLGSVGRRDRLRSRFSLRSLFHPSDRTGRGPIRLLRRRLESR